MTLLIIYITLALGVSFLCSIMEAVLLSVTPSYVAKLEGESGKAGMRLADMKQNVDKPLAAILSLNTIAHTVGAAGAGAQATVVFGNQYVGIASAILTFLILVVSEIIPKTLGALHWRKLALPVAALLHPIIIAMWPLVKMAEYLSKLLSRGAPEAGIGRDEFHALAEYGVREGVLLEHESRLLGNVLRFGDLVARDVMTPRTVMFVLPESMTVAQAVDDHAEMPFSRIPIISKDKDRVTGFVLKTEILTQAAQGSREVVLKDIAQGILSVAATIPLHTLFQRLVEEKSHIAIVLDEYGGTAGLITLEDVVESLLGLEIVDEADTVEDMQHLAREKWSRRMKNRIG